MATWARAALASLSDVPAVRRGGLALTEGGGRRLRFTASDRDGGRVDWCHIDAYDDVPLNTAIRRAKPNAQAALLIRMVSKHPDIVKYLEAV